MLSMFFRTTIRTGFPQQINTQTDIGTNYHLKRQFTSVITIAPDSPSLITFIYLGEPVLRKHNGFSTA